MHCTRGTNTFPHRAGCSRRGCSGGRRLPGGRRGVAGGGGEGARAGQGGRRILLSHLNACIAAMSGKQMWPSFSTFSPASPASAGISLRFRSYQSVTMLCNAVQQGNIEACSGVAIELYLYQAWRGHDTLSVILQLHGVLEGHGAVGGAALAPAPQDLPMAPHPPHGATGLVCKCTLPPYKAIDSHHHHHRHTTPFKLPCTVFAGIFEMIGDWFGKVEPC